MKRTRPTISARKRKADQTSTSEVGEVGGRGRRQRQKKVVREAGEEENRPEAEQQVEEHAIEAEEEARPDAQAVEAEARPDGQAEEEPRPDAQTEEEARTDAHTEAVEPEAARHEDDAHTEALVVRRGRGRGRQQRQRHDEVPVGPEDPSLLKDFMNHVAADIWNGRERQLLKIYNHSRYLKIWELPTTNRRFMAKVTSSGLFPLAQISYRYCNKVLVSAFVERWHPETNSFHFRFGEMTITLEDVLYLVGLPVEGLAVHAEVHNREDCVALVHRCLGVTMAQASDVVSCGGVKLHWLKDNFMNVGDDATDERVDCCARAFLLYLLGTTLFVDKTGIRVNVSYLALLSDLGQVRRYAWGVGALGFLYRQLGQASRSHVKQMSGYTTLLEAWIQEHFSMFQHAMNANYTEELPRAARWQSRKEAKSATTVRYREMLDDVQASQVVFDPYRECRQVVADIALYTGCICCMIVVEPYLPDRVLRQFGLVKLVPGPPLAPLRGTRGSTSATYSVVYQYTDALWQNWHDHMLHEDKRVPVTPGIPWESHQDYLPWFRRVSHLKVARGRGDGHNSESAEERTTAALVLLDNCLSGTHIAPYEMKNTLREVQRILRGQNAAHPSTPGPSSDMFFTRHSRRNQFT
ncbi:hypothetical protein RHGRI_023533 [Rhododendron griersonianum]|uniref:Aminotransferase-like plant mobile domain-containing protein n=1 Tax=Rhododendron griersonianum TaxID=479676 RepID=A0AAV6J543_9ERIC|nr:hypothetical protein RHGRI_023533 [Rhododendron griersonianum]